MGLSVVLVTSGQPSANPRLVKEATALCAAGYKVTVVYCPLSPWADEYDRQLFLRLSEIQWISVGYHPRRHRLRYTLTRWKRKLFDFVFQLSNNSPSLAWKSFVLYGSQLAAAAKKVKAVLYIGHNLGSLPAVVLAAEKNHAKVAFDFEDYHRGEDNLGSLHHRMVSLIENKYVPRLEYATAASPQIAAAYRQHFKEIPIYTINNTFPYRYSTAELQTLDAQPIKLFWFSQYVGKGRGLELVIEAIGKTGDRGITLTLLGNCSDEMRIYFNELINMQGLSQDQIIFLSPVAEEEIIKVAATHHIGLAVEVPHIQNRELCLTNKIFMYLLAGNAIIFSNTVAQASFFNEHSNIGSLFFNGDTDQLTTLLKAYRNDPALLMQHRQGSLTLGKVLNWDQEQHKFLSIVRECLG